MATNINTTLPPELIECIILHRLASPFAPVVARVCVLWRQLMRGRHGDAGRRLGANVLDEATFRGHIDLIDWLVDRACPLTAGACASAARGGNMDVIVHLRAKGCP